MAKGSTRKKVKPGVETLRPTMQDFWREAFSAHNLFPTLNSQDFEEDSRQVQAFKSHLDGAENALKSLKALL